ncbi:MAG: hypothetical protein APR53_10680 [Methanoculleus sp. SDB]|nr:MAG: hypothetical protein APR53_10680 [Methanoculleus sp. SDB]
MKIRFLTAFIVLAALLLSAGCTGTSPAPNDTGPGTAVPSAALTSPTPENCTFDYLTGNAENHFFREDSCYFRTHTPVDFLTDLRDNPHQPVMVRDVPEGWITPFDAELLMREIDSDEPAAPVVSPISSYWPFNQTSTVGNEALFLLEGYRSGTYPPALCSLYYFHPNRTEVRSWWNASGKGGGQ